MSKIDRRNKRTGVSIQKPPTKGNKYPCISCNRKGYVIKGQECGYCGGTGWVSQDTMLDRPSL